MITVADTADSMDSQDASYRMYDNQRSKVQLFTPPQGCFPCRRLKVGYMPVVGAVFVCLFQHVSIMCLSIAHLGQLAQKQGGSACCQDAAPKYVGQTSAHATASKHPLPSPMQRGMGQTWLKVKPRTPQRGLEEPCAIFVDGTGLFARLLQPA